MTSEREYFICPQVRGTHNEPRKNKDQMEGRLRLFLKRLASCRANRGSLQDNGEGLGDIQRLKLKLRGKFTLIISKSFLSFTACFTKLHGPPFHFVAFVRTHSNLAFLWHKDRNFQAITGDCKLAALFILSGASRPGNWTPFYSISLP